MTPERWQQIEEVLHGALDRRPQDRASFVEEECAGDDELKLEAASLVRAYEEADEFMERPAMAEDARVLVGPNFADNIGRDIGPYKILQRLGAGGMGEVYLAHDGRLDRLVALKILPAYFGVDDEHLRRFQREARAASALNHPNILTIHEVGESEGVRFIATEFIDGQTIRELIERRELTLGEVLDIAEQVASGLCIAHAAGIVHRDIKPENIMRRTDGLVKILDFGIAKLLEPEFVEYSHGTNSNVRLQTEAGLVMGTVSYMSPEQARGLLVDERTDIWSFGVVVYEMLAQHPPFEGNTRIDTMVSILEREPPPLSEVREVDPASALLEPILNKCLRKNKTQRYQAATDLLVDLHNVRRQLKDPAQLTAPAFSRLTESIRAVPRLRVSWPLLFVALLVVALFGTFLYRRSRSQARANLLSSPEIKASTKKLYAEMNEIEKLAFVNEQEQRISMMMGDGPVKLNEEAIGVIKSYVDRYVDRDTQTSVRPGAERLEAVYARAIPYVPLIARSFAARKVPIIIGIYLPVIESNYRECYENGFGAKGLFQFLPQTALNYGVTPEQMCDVKKMTPAAAHYIADRMAELGDDSQSVTLVLLSYNRGPEWVRNTLRELRGTDNYERNFWTLFAHRNKLDENFQHENAWYVPNFFAAAIIGENPQAFGLSQPPLSTLTETAPSE
ncbi:MAG: protein kinase [Pyrinomonadaceae bacterium]